MGFPEYKISTAKKILEYIQKVSEMSFPPKKEADPRLEHLLRAALELPESEKNVIGLLRNLEVGVLTSRRLVAILQTFKGGGYEAPSVDLKKIIAEGFGTQPLGEEKIAYGRIRSARALDVEPTEEEPETEGDEREEFVHKPQMRTPMVRKTPSKPIHPSRKTISKPSEAIARDAEGLANRRCLFHGGIAIARCSSCKAILCKECVRDSDNRCPRCNAPLSKPPSKEAQKPERQAPHRRIREHEDRRDFTRL